MTLSTKQKVDKKLTKIKPGHWRNKWRRPIGSIDLFSGRVHSAGEGVGDRRFPSRELAEAFAERAIARNAAAGFGSLAPVYLGPVFFPDGGSNA